MQQLWLVLLGCGVMLGVIALFAALRVELDARGFGEPSGAWAGAFGIGFPAGALSGVCGRGVPLALELHVFGRRFPLKWRARAARAAPPESAPEKPDSTEPMSARVERWLSSPPELETLLRVGKWVLLDRLSLDASYGFRDIALTGRVAGALYALSGALPEKVHLTQRPNWDGSERWELSLAGRLSFYPVLVLLTLLWYMLRTRWQRGRLRGPSPQRTLESPT